jgi:Voltage-dependent anion channel
MHTLKDACAAKGKDLVEVVRDLESAYAASEAHNLVPPTISIRELSRRFPATRPIFERYGLGDCGGEDGPEEPLAWFATVHRLPLEEFLRDVREAAVKDISASPAAPAKTTSLFSPHFVMGSLFLTLTLGVPLTYHPQYWSLVFPLGMFTAATFQLSRATGIEFLAAVPRAFVWVALVAWTITFLGMARDLARSAARGLRGADDEK